MSRSVVPLPAAEAEHLDLVVRTTMQQPVRRLQELELAAEVLAELFAADLAVGHGQEEASPSLEEALSRQTSEGAREAVVLSAAALVAWADSASSATLAPPFG